MKKDTKLKTHIFPAFVLSAFALVGLGGLAYRTNGFTNWNINTWFSDETPSENNNAIIEVKDSSTLSVRMVGITENNDGSTTYTYTYAFTPNNTTRREVVGELEYVDSSVEDDIEDCLTWELDWRNQEFSITKHSDFSHQAKLTLTSKANSSISVVITIDCKQRVSINPNVASMYDYTNRELTNSQILSSEKARILSFTDTYTIPLVENVDYSCSFSFIGMVLHSHGSNGYVESYFSEDFYAFDDLEDNMSVDYFIDVVIPDIIENEEMNEDDIGTVEANMVNGGASFGYNYDFTLFYKDDEIVVEDLYMDWNLVGSGAEWGIKPTGMNVESTSIVY